MIYAINPIITTATAELDATMTIVLIGGPGEGDGSVVGSVGFDDVTDSVVGSGTGLLDIFGTNSVT